MRKLSLALVAAAGILAGCSGGGSKVASSIPSTGATQAVTLSAQIAVDRISQSGNRQVKYIPANAISMTITVYGPTATAATGTPFSQTCTAIPASTTQVNMQISAPAIVAFGGAGGDIFVITSNAGPCTPSATGSAGTLAVLSSFTSGISFVGAGSVSLNQVIGATPIVLGAPVGSAAGANTLTGSLSLLSTVTSFAVDSNMTGGQREGMLLNLTITDGNGNTLTSPAASGSASTCGAGTGATAPCNAASTGSIVGSFSNPRAGSIPLNTPLQLRVIDTLAPSNNGAAPATANNFAIAQVVTNKALYDPSGTACGGVACVNGQILSGSAVPGTAAAEVVNITNAPAAGTAYILFFNGGTQDVVLGATVTLRTAGAAGALASSPVVLATLPVTTQALVQTDTLGTPITTASTTAVDIASDFVNQLGGGTIKYVTDGLTGIYTEKPAATGITFAVNAVTAPQNAAQSYNSITVAPNTAVAGSAGGYTNALSNGLIFTADSLCQTNATATCFTAAAAGATGLYTFNALTTGAFATLAAATGITQTYGTPVNGPGPNGSFGNTLGNGQQPGPVGVYAFPNGAPAVATPAGYYTQRTFFVASNNSIYKMQLNAAGTAADTTLLPAPGPVTLIAGSNNATTYALSVGSFTTDNVNGNLVRFDFGVTNHIAMTSNAVGTNGCGATAAAATTLFVGDFNNKRIRTVSLQPPYAVTTLGGAFGFMQGLSYDACNATLVITNSNLDGNNTIFNVNATTGAVLSTLVAGSSTASVDGTGTVGYPLQFVIGNAMTTATGANAYPGLGLGTNSSATVGGATTTNPRGIVWDPANSYFYFLDGSATGLRSAS